MGTLKETEKSWEFLLQFSSLAELLVRMEKPTLQKKDRNNNNNHNNNNNNNNNNKLKNYRITNDNKVH